LNRKIIGITGYKKSGKTTLVEGLLRLYTARGLRVATVKHAHHSFEIDHKGRDSYRHRAAGASEVAVVSRHLWALVHELGGEPEPSLDDMLGKLAPCDLVIVEGYKRDSHLKIEVRDLALYHPEIAPMDPTVIAIASTGPLPGANIPVFSRDDVEAIAGFIAAKLELA
jgi:molybdopterin-guanine dinucleotide biosynthesis protein B